MFLRSRNLLLGVNASEVLYQYRIRPVWRLSSLLLAGVLIGYSYSFQNVTILLARKRVELLQDECDQGKSNGKTVAVSDKIKAYAPLGLTILPVTLTFGLLYGLTRIVTQIKVLQVVNGNGIVSKMVQIERRTPVLGIKFTKLLNINQLNKVRRSKIYTGAGSNGISDSKTSCFYIYDRLAKYWVDKYYIMMRNGIVLNNDGKVLDRFFEPPKPGFDKGQFDTEQGILTQLHTDKVDNKGQTFKFTHSFSESKSNEYIKEIILKTDQNLNKSKSKVNTKSK